MEKLEFGVSKGWGKEWGFDFVCGREGCREYGVGERCLENRTREIGFPDV